MLVCPVRAADLQRVRSPAFVSRIEEGAGPRSRVFREGEGYAARLKHVNPTEADRRIQGKLAKVLPRFFVSDGLGDSSKQYTCTQPTTGDRCQEPIDTSFCQPLKNRGIKIAVLYTTYLPLPQNAWYNQWIAPFQNKIGTKMQACASPGYYFEVSPTQGISAAMNALFLRILQNPRLIN